MATPTLQLNLVADDIMRQPVITVTPNQSLAELEEVLLESHISGVPVIDHGTLVGVVSRSDLLRVQVLMESLDGQITQQLLSLSAETDGFKHHEQEAFHGFKQRLAGLKVRDAMRTQVITCHRDTPVSTLAADMLRHHVHRVIVVEKDRPIGVISSLDVVRLVADELAPRAGGGARARY